MSAKKIKNKLTPLSIVMLVILIGYCLLMVALFAFAIMTSLKDPNLYVFVTMQPDKTPYFKNFEQIFNVTIQINTSKGPVSSDLLNIVFESFIYAGGCALVNTLVVGITAYLSATYNYKYSKIVYTIVIVTMVIPIIGSQASEMNLLMDLGLHDTWIGLFLLKANFLGIYFLVFHEFFKSTPKAYEEAAMIDGANDVKVMCGIYFPLAKAVFGTVFLINFINFWNDYQTPLLFAPSHPTLSRFMIEISRMSSEDFSSPPMQMASTMVLIIPTLTLFLIFQKKMLSSIAVGGIKG